MRLWNYNVSGPHKRFSAVRLRRLGIGKMTTDLLAWACNRLIPFRDNPARSGFL